MLIDKGNATENDGIEPNAAVALGEISRYPIGEGEGAGEDCVCGSVSAETLFGAAVDPLIVTLPLPLTAAGIVICAVTPELLPRLTEVLDAPLELTVALVDVGGGVTPAIGATAAVGMAL